MKQIAVIVLLSIACFWLLQENCRKTRQLNAPTEDAVKRAVDSVIRVVDSLDVVKFEQDEADKFERSRLMYERDSLRIVLSNTWKALNQSQRTAVRLASEVELAKRNRDTAEYISNCDSLSDEVQLRENVIELLRGELNEYTITSDSVIASLDSAIKRREAEFSRLRKSFDYLNEQNKFLGLKINNLHDKAGRQFTVGVGLGYGTGVDGRLQPQGGVYVVRRLFNFKL